jgi:cell division protein FtsI/penicillin-binding protein 2
MTLLAAALLMAAIGGDPLLDRRFPGAELNYLVIDVRTHQVVASRWPDAESPIPVGSLVKPFTALAFGRPYPDFNCRGERDHCWLARGHGQVGFRDALAQSCNAYFLDLARGVDAHSLAVVAASFGIPAPLRETPETRIGLGDGWRIPPLALLRAYVELSARRTEPKVAQILTGLERAAAIGTAAALGRESSIPVFAKTGTAPCIAKQKHAGDGFVVVLDPADSPRLAILVRVHGVPGAEAAKSAARILTLLRTGR